MVKIKQNIMTIYIDALEETKESNICLITESMAILKNNVFNSIQEEAGYGVNYNIIDMAEYNQWIDYLTNAIKLKFKVKYEIKVKARPIIILNGKNK